MKEEIAEAELDKHYVEKIKPEKKEKSSKSKAKINLFDSPKKIGIILTFFISITQILQGIWSAHLNENTNAKIEETKRIQEFSDRIIKSIPVITGEEIIKSKVALVALYVMAQENTDKKSIIDIALLSEKEELRQAMIFIIKSDPEIDKELEQYTLDVINLQASEQIKKEQEKTDLTMVDDDNDAAKTDVPLENITLEIRTSADLTTRISGKQGWIYIGKVEKEDESEKLLKDKTISVKKIPKQNDKIITSTFVTLRNKGTSINSKVIGVLPKNQTVEVLKVTDGVELKSGAKAFWAKVKVFNYNSEKLE